MDKKQKKIFAVIVSVAVVSFLIISSIIVLVEQKDEIFEEEIGMGYDGDYPETAAVTEISADVPNDPEASGKIINDVLVSEPEDYSADNKTGSFNNAENSSGTVIVVENSPGTVTSTVTASTGTTVTQESADIHIKNRDDAANVATPMVFKNMFPGDSISQTYTLTVDLTLNSGTKPVLYFYCASRDISDVLLLNGITLNLAQNGQTVWQGTAADINGMGKSLVQKLYNINPGANGNFTYKWDVEITASLPTSAGNEYQNLKAILDFYWAIGVEGEIDGDDIKDVPVVSPKTGDRLHAAIWGLIVLAALSFIILIIIKLRKDKDEQDSQQGPHADSPAARL